MPIEQARAPTLEIARVLFVNIVTYSKLPMDSRGEYLQTLQNRVSAMPEFERTKSDDRLLRLPTDDGMALVSLPIPGPPSAVRWN